MRRAAAVATARGRVAHLLRWDVARLAFDTPEILARHPEIDGVTHAAIRVAAGGWAREAVRRWDLTAPAGDVLIGETPLIGERFASLARPSGDDLEPLLASRHTLFLVPVPSREVRAVIEAARTRDTTLSDQGHDRSSAPPHLVRSHWEDLVRVAGDVGVPGAETVSEYDPDLYARTYLRLLRHRHARMLGLYEVVPAAGPAEAVVGTAELVPTADEVAAAMAAIGPQMGEAERIAAGWYRF